MKSKVKPAFYLEKLRPFLEKLPLFLAPLYPLAFLAGNAATEMAILFTVICFALHLMLKKELPFLKERWLQILGLFILYALARNIFLDHPGKAISLILHMVEFIFFALALAYWVLTTDKRHKRLLFSMALVLAFTIFDSFYQYMYGVDLFGWQAKIDTRLTGPFEYMRVGAFIAFLMFPVLTVYLDKLWRRYPHFGGHLVGVGVMGVVLLVLLLSGERVTLIYYVLGYAVMLFLWRKHHLPMLRITIIMSVTTALLLLGFVFVKHTAPESLAPLEKIKVYQSIKNRFLGNTVEIMKQNDTGHYRQIWSRAYTMFTYAPLFGVGVHQFDIRCPDAVYGPTDNIHLRCSNHIHHFYLELLTETGIIGFALIVTVFLMLLAKIWATRQRWDEVPLLLGVFTAYFISIWPLAMFRGFFQSWRAALLWFVIGWMLAAIRTYGKPSDKSHTR